MLILFYLCVYVGLFTLMDEYWLRTQIKPTILKLTRAGRDQSDYKSSGDSVFILYFGITIIV